jgi:hypothetical protein
LPGKKGLSADWERGSATVQRAGASEWKYEVSEVGRLIMRAIVRTQGEAKKAAEFVVTGRLEKKHQPP